MAGTSGGRNTSTRVLGGTPPSPPPLHRTAPLTNTFLVLSFFFIKDNMKSSLGSTFHQPAHEDLSTCSPCGDLAPCAPVSLVRYLRRLWLLLSSILPQQREKYLSYVLMLIPWFTFPSCRGHFYPPQSCMCINDTS